MYAYDEKKQGTYPTGSTNARGMHAYMCACVRYDSGYVAAYARETTNGRYSTKDRLK